MSTFTTLWVGSGLARAIRMHTNSLRARPILRLPRTLKQAAKLEIKHFSHVASTEDFIRQRENIEKMAWNLDGREEKLEDTEGEATDIFKEHAKSREAVDAYTESSVREMREEISSAESKDELGNEVKGSEWPKKWILKLVMNKKEKEVKGGKKLKKVRDKVAKKREKAVEVGTVGLTEQGGTIRRIPGGFKGEVGGKGLVRLVGGKVKGAMEPNSNKSDENEPKMKPTEAKTEERDNELAPFIRKYLTYENTLIRKERVS